MIGKIKSMLGIVVPKREVYEREIADLRAKKLRKAMQISLLGDSAKNSCMYNKVKKDLALVNLQLEDIVSEYNTFVAKENAAQKAFEQLNGFDKK